MRRHRRFRLWLWGGLAAVMLLVAVVMLARQEYPAMFAAAGFGLVNASIYISLFRSGDAAP